MYLYAMCVKKMNPRSLIVVGMPLSMLITEQHKNVMEVPVLTLTMGAKIQGTVVEARGQPTLSGQDSGNGVQQDVTLEEACSGKYGLLCGHPEAFASQPGQEMLRRMSKEGLIFAVMVDEVHQGNMAIYISIQPFHEICCFTGLEGHWDKIRPNMLRKVYEKFWS